MEHELKCWPDFYEEIVCGNKTFEIRSEEDRKFNVGDILHLREFRPCRKCKGAGRYQDDAQNGEMENCTCRKPHGRYTGRETRRRVTYVMHGPVFGLEEGWVIMAVWDEFNLY